MPERPNFVKNSFRRRTSEEHGEAAQNLQLLYEEAVALAEQGLPLGYIAPFIEKAQQEVDTLRGQKTIFRNQD